MYENLNRKNLKKIRKIVVETYSDFAENTSIHGIKYTVYKKATIFEKLLWAILVLISVVGALFLLSLFWERYTSNPTRTNILTTTAPTTVIPFPAVTICNENKMLESKLRPFVQKLYLGNVSSEAVRTKLPQILAYIYDREYNIDDLKYLQDLFEANDFVNVHSVMKRLSQNCNEMLVRCRWNNQIVDCRQLFTSAAIRDGLCCSFNAKLNSKEIDNYTYSFGLQMGLSVVIDPMKQEVQHSRLHSLGVKVIIHDPKDYPGIHSIKKIVGYGKQTFFSVLGTQIVCSDEVRALTIDQRGCVFEDERSLRYFSEYRDTNCFIECVALGIFEYCQCVPYYFDFPGKAVCNYSKIPCIREFRNMNLCDCPNQCDDTFYTVLSTGIAYIGDYEFSTSSFLNGLNNTNDNILIHVYFGSESQTILRRDVITSMVYLLSSFGGVFSLFLGCSFVSGAEIIYYLFIRFPIKLKIFNGVDTSGNKRDKFRNKAVNQTRTERYGNGRYQNGIAVIYGNNVFLP